jgi:hypothetical protein
MRPPDVVVIEIIGKQPLEESLAEDNDVVERLPSAGTDEAFGIGVLPR